MNTILNIGLLRNDTKLPLNYLFVEQVMLHLGFNVLDIKLFQSNSEPTAVVTIRSDGGPYTLHAALYDLAVFLKQDCIGCYFTDCKVGILGGPEVKKWGPFNPALFLMPDSRRLSEHLNNILLYGTDQRQFRDLENHETILSTDEFNFSGQDQGWASPTLSVGKMVRDIHSAAPTIKFRRKL
jgi:hypothetical protein